MMWKVFAHWLKVTTRSHIFKTFPRQLGAKARARLEFKVPSEKGEMVARNRREADDVVK